MIDQKHEKAKTPKKVESATLLIKSEVIAVAKPMSRKIHQHLLLK